jgi:hypothetical protein
MDFLVNILWFCVWGGFLAFLIYWSNKRRSENKVNIDNLKLSETGEVISNIDLDTKIKAAQRIIIQKGCCMNIQCSSCCFLGKDHFSIGNYKEAAIKFLKENGGYDD